MSCKKKCYTTFLTLNISHKISRLLRLFSIENNFDKELKNNLQKVKNKLGKNKNNVRSGIRTHAYKSRLRPERSALDRSAILTIHWQPVANTLLIYTIILTCKTWILLRQRRSALKWWSKFGQNLSKSKRKMYSFVKEVQRQLYFRLTWIS